MPLPLRPPRALWPVGAGVLFVVFGAALVRKPGIAGIGVAVLLAVMLLALLVSVITADDSPEEKQRILHWTMGSFALHALIGAGIASVPAIIAYMGPDAFGYHALAATKMAGWVHGHEVVVGLGPEKSGFVQLLAMFYWISTPSMIAGAVLSAMLAAGMVPLVNRTTQLLFGSAHARLAPAITTFAPPLLVWPSQVLREAPILFLLTAVMLAATTLQRRWTLMSTVVLLVSGVLLFQFRGTIAYPLVATIVIAILLARRQIMVGLLNATTVAVLLVVVIGILGFGLSGYEIAADQDLEDLSRFRQATSHEAASGFDDTSETTTNDQAAGYLFVAVPRLLVGPFPWEINDSRLLPGVVDGFVWWFLIFWAMRGFHRARWLGTRRKLLTLLLPAVAITVLLALGLGNFGLLIRQRTQILVFLLPLIAIGLRRDRTAPDPTTLDESRAFVR